MFRYLIHYNHIIMSSTLIRENCVHASVQDRVSYGYYVNQIFNT